MQWLSHSGQFVNKANCPTFFLFWKCLNTCRTIQIRIVQQPTINVTLSQLKTGIVHFSWALPIARTHNHFSTLVPGSGSFQLPQRSWFGGFRLWVSVRVLRVLGSVYHNRFPNTNHNLNHNPNRNLTLTTILTQTNPNPNILLTLTITVTLTITLTITQIPTLTQTVILNYNPSN